jgi:hypothetical protein
VKSFGHVADVLTALEGVYSKLISDLCEEDDDLDIVTRRIESERNVKSLRNLRVNKREIDDWEVNEKRSK